jgi:tRNA G46 methylase TrmB
MSFAEFFKNKANRKNELSPPRAPPPAESQSLSPSTAGRDATTTKVYARLSGQGKVLSKDTGGRKLGAERNGADVHAHASGMREKSRGSRGRKRPGRGDAHQTELSKSPLGASRNKSRKRARTGSVAHPPTAKAAKKKPPTSESLELSDRLRWLSRQKRAKEATDTFWDVRYETVRDPHHACMLVDCCARAAHPGCDASLVNAAERASRAVTGPTHPASVELQTALIKLYAKVGLLSRADRVLKAMCRAEVAKPNVRTLNTLLRGCLWTSAVGPESDEPREGGKSSASTPEQAKHSAPWKGSGAIAEEAWCQYREAVGTREDAFDSSSFEYSILLLCQSLNVNAAQTRIGELQAKYGIRVKGKATFVATNPCDSYCDVLETLAIVYLALSRAYALLGQMEETWQSCQRVLSAVSLCEKVRSEVKAVKNDSCYVGGEKAQRTIAHGGKRQWKSKSLAPDDNEQQKQQEQIHRREASNAAYREHKMREVQEEARSMLRIRRELRGEQPLSPSDLRLRLSTALFIFPPDEGSSRHEAALASDTAAWYSYGGCVVGSSLGMASPAELRHEDALHKSGAIKIRKVFSEQAAAQLDVELGSGYGDWIVQSAASQPGRNHIAVEVRADRVFQIFAKASFGADGRPLRNLCVVGSDAGSFLGRRIELGSVSTVYVHHPEPPTQSFGGNQADLDAVMQSLDVASEPNHMLRSDTIVAAARALKPDGKLVVVTDNRNYGRLVCATLAKLSRARPEMIRCPTFHELESSGLRRSNDTPRMAAHASSIALYEKRLGSSAGTDAASQSASSTWFDRLWTTAGASSSHAEQHTRYVILMYRAKDPTK